METIFTWFTLLDLNGLVSKIFIYLRDGN